MALPYTIILSITAYIMVISVLEPATQYMYDNHMIEHHSTYELTDKMTDNSAH